MGELAYTFGSKPILGMPATAIVRGYRDMEIEGVRILMSGQWRGITGTPKQCSSGEGHRACHRAHEDGWAAGPQYPLKGAMGDALRTVTCGAGTTCV